MGRKKESEYKEQIRREMTSKEKAKSSKEKAKSSKKPTEIVIAEEATIKEPRGSRQIVVFSDTVHQKNLIKDAAKAAGLSMSQYVFNAAWSATQAK